MQIISTSLAAFLPNLVDLKTVRYAKIDSNNNIITAGAGGWTESPYQMAVGRRRSAASGYNGYLYAVGGYEAVSGVLADIGNLSKLTSYWRARERLGCLGRRNQPALGRTVPISNSYAYVIGGCTAGASPGGCTTRTDVIQTFRYTTTTAVRQPATVPAPINIPPRQIVSVASAAILNGYLYVAGGRTSATDCTTTTSDISYTTIDANGNLGTWSSTSAALPEGGAWGHHWKLLVAISLLSGRAGIRRYAVPRSIMPT